MDRNLVKVFLKYVSLSVAGMIGISCYILADTFFIAKGTGSDGLAALNFTFPPWYIMYGTSLMIAIGASSRFSISKNKKLFSHGFYTAMFFGCLISVTAIAFAPSAVAFMGADGGIKEMASVYIRILLGASPLFFLSNLLIFFARNDANPSIAMKAMLAGSFANIILDYVFILLFDMEMTGAALATIISPITSILVLLKYILKRRDLFSPFADRISLRISMDILSMGIYAFLSDIAAGISVFYFNILILENSGAIGVAAYGIIANTALVVNAVFAGIGQGMQPLIADFKGKGDIFSARKILCLSIVLSAGFFLIVYLLVFFMASQIVSSFNSLNNTALKEIAENGIRIYFLSFAFSGINIVFSVCLGAYDQPKEAFAVSILRGIAVMLPCLFLLNCLLGLNGIWMSPAVAEFVVMFVSLFFVRKYFYLQKA